MTEAGAATQRSGRIGDVVWGGACAAFGGVYAAALYALNPRAFFNDDSQEAFAPIFMAIGRSLSHGRWPALTLQMLNGGALANEYQYALYNPFSLFTCWVASQFGDQAAAEAAVAGLHFAVLGAGAFAFARACGANRPLAALAGVAFVANNFLYYWLAESWITGLVSIAWMTWALAGLIKAHESRWAWVGGALATALVVTSGCYHTVVMLGMATAVIALVRWRLEGVRQALAPMVSAALGVLLAAAAVLPVLAMGQVAIRNGGLNNAGQLAIDLYGVLAPSSPFHTGHLVDFDGPAKLSAPIYFAGWFLLPLLPLIDWKKLGRPLPTLISLLAMAAVFVVATQGLEQIFSVRYPIWNLAPLHLALLAAFALIASEGGVCTIEPAADLGRGGHRLLRLAGLAAGPAGDAREGLCRGARRLRPGGPWRRAAPSLAERLRRRGDRRRRPLRGRDAPRRSRQPQPARPAPADAGDRDFGPGRHPGLDRRLPGQYRRGEDLAGAGD